MDAHQSLLDTLKHDPSPLLSPQPLAHSQELAEGLPMVRRHVGPRPWYQLLETLADPPAPRNEKSRP